LGDVRRIVLGTPGLVDPGTGDIVFAWNLPRWHRGLAAALRDDLHTTILFENDVNLAAVAEAHNGAARDVKDFLLFWVGGGLGLAVVLGGRLHRGFSGAAGEIGYLPVPGAEITREVTRRGKGAFQQIAAIIH
jgi:predicted NBD/HSP70 family sugar kinase